MLYPPRRTYSALEGGGVVKGIAVRSTFRKSIEHHEDTAFQWLFRNISLQVAVEISD
jgi:hypothetical protein